MKQRKPQQILPTDADRAVFKQRCKKLLKPLEEEFGISFEFSRIDEMCSMPGNASARMRVWIHQESKKTLWDSPAAVALVDAMTASKPKPPQLEIIRSLDSSSFTPEIWVVKNGKKWFRFFYERLEDVGLLDKHIVPIAFDDLQESLEHQFPDEKEDVALAIKLLKTQYDLRQQQKALYER